MRHRFWPPSAALPVSLVLLITAFTCQASDPAPITAENSSRETSTLTDLSVAAGLQVTQVASVPLIQWPIAAALDQDRSLVVLECHWDRTSVQQQLQSKPHKVVRLIDKDDDGRFDQRQEIASNLSFPEGILIFDRSSLLITTPPIITKVTDNDGDGYFEDHSVWFDAGTLTHCANDLHGPMRGPDGWIYWTKGAFAEQTLPLIHGPNRSSTASHIYRRHPQGGPVDRLMTGGMDNPVDLAFLPNGERLFCSTFFHHPGDGLRDGIAHAIYGSVFGKSHQVLDGHPRTGALMQPMIELGPAAPAALATLSDRQLVSSSEAWPPATKHDQFMVSAQFNLHKVGLHRLTTHGATYAAQTIDLLSSPRIDFHPVDVIEDHDGSLLVLDTGAWYDLCCPSSGVKGQLAPGGIYRLSSKHSRADDRSFSTERNATNIASERESDVDTIESELRTFRNQQLPGSKRMSSFWDLSRHLLKHPNHVAIRQAVIAAIDDPDQMIRQAAAHVISLYRMPEAQPILLKSLSQAPPILKRLIAECLGRIQQPDPEVVRLLIQEAKDAEHDRALEHSLLYALIELNAADELRPYLKDTDGQIRLVALQVLHEINHLNVDDMPFLLSTIHDGEPKLRERSLQTLALHPEWAAQAIEWLQQEWKDNPSTEWEALATLCASWQDTPELAPVIESWMNQQAPHEAQCKVLIRLLNSLQGRELPAAWLPGLTDKLQAPDSPMFLAVADALSQVKWNTARDEKLIEPLVRYANDESRPLDQRLRCILAIPRLSEGISGEMCQAIVTGLVSEQPDVSNQCSAAITHVRLTQEAAEQLYEQIDRISPLNLEAAWLALLNATNPLSDEKLIERLESSPTSQSLPSERIFAHIQRMSPQSKAAWESAFLRLNTPPEDVVKVLDDWIAKLPEGDAVRGQQLFNDQKIACVQCHRVGYVGGRVGPELTRIGSSRTRRDLLEAVLFPSQRLEQSYRPVRVLTVDGQVFNGLVMHRTATQLILNCDGKQSTVIPIDTIESEQLSNLSIMPMGLTQTLTIDQFADLLRFLESAR